MSPWRRPSSSSKGWSLLYKTRAEAEADEGVDSMPRCSCLPFCFWRGSRSRRTEAARGKRRRRFRLSWLSWPWLRRRSGRKDAAGGGCTKTAGKQPRGRRLLPKTLLQAKKALASVAVSSDSRGLLPRPATVSSFGDAKNQNRSKPRPITDGTRRQLQACVTMTTASTRGSTAPARPAGTNNQPCATATTDEPALAAAGGIWRDPSRRHYSPHDRAERPTAGLWTAATTLGVIVLFGRVTAVFFLCSCLYGVRFVRLRASAAGARAKSGGGGASISRRFGDPIGVAAEKVAELCVTEECKKKVVMAGLLERPGQRPSSRFGR